jgi:hypothetical protein
METIEGMLRKRKEDEAEWGDEEEAETETS